MPRKKIKEEPEVQEITRREIDTDSLTDQLLSRFSGSGVLIQRASEAEGRFDLRRPCGIPSLDIACGGGLPAGGLSQIDGPDGVGKNYLTNRYFANVQKLYGEAFRGFMLCLEYPFDKAFARLCGFKVAFSPYEIEVEQRRRHNQGESLLTEEEEQELRTEIGKFYILRGSSAEAQLDVSVEYITSNGFQLAAIDSWDSMLTVSEEEKTLEEDPRIANPQGVQTRWMKKVCAALTPKRLCPSCFGPELEFKRHGHGGTWNCSCGWKGREPLIEENETTLIGIRQARANLNKMGMHAREWKVGGAWALKHGKLIDIQLRPGDPLMNKTKTIKIGKEIHWEITKGKAGTHEGKKGTYSMYFEPLEVDRASDLYNYCLTNAVITQEGSVYGIPRPDGSVEKVKGQEVVRRMIEEDTVLQNVLWDLALHKANLGHIRHR